MSRLDTIFKNKLSHHNEAVSAGMWEKLESRLPVKVNRRPLYFLASAMFFCLLFSGWYQQHLLLERKYSLLSKPIAEVKKTKKDIFIQPELQFSSEKKLSADKPVEIKQITLTSRKPEETSLLIPVESIKEENTIANVFPSDVAYGFRPEEQIASLASGGQRPFPVREHIKVGVVRTIGTGSIEMTSQQMSMKESKGCPFHYDTQNKSVDIYYSSDYAIKTLVAADPSLSEHISMRQQTESATYSYGMGMRFGYNVSYRWNIHTGFHYAQINEKFEYTDPESSQTRLITIKDFVYENGKIVDSIITEEVVIIPGMTKLKIFNKYRSFDIPLLGRYTLFANRWMSLSGLAGIYINLSSRQRGMMLGPDNKTLINIASEESNQAGYFKTQLGVSGMGGLSFAFHIAPSADILVEPHARFFPSYMNTERNPANQKFTVAGLTTGFRLKF